MNLARSFVWLVVLCLLGLAGACDERWSPGSGSSDCRLDHPSLAGSLREATFVARGWAAGCLRVKGAGPAPIFAAAVKLGSDGQIWAFDAAKGTPLRLQLPASLRSDASSFSLIIPGQGIQNSAAQPGYDLAARCQQFVEPATPCEKRAEANACWFTMSLQLSLPDGSPSQPIAGHPGKSCVLYPPNEDSEGGVIDGSPGDVVFPEGPSTCKPGETRPCRDYLPCLGEQRCRDSGFWDVCQKSQLSEICDGLDNDCDGQIDEGCEGTTCTAPKIHCVETVVGRSGVAGDTDGVRGVVSFRRPEDVVYDATHKILFVTDHSLTGGRLRLVQLEGAADLLGSTVTIQVALSSAGGLAPRKGAPTLAGVFVSQPGTKNGLGLTINVASRLVFTRSETQFRGPLGWGVARDELGGGLTFFAGEMALYTLSPVEPTIDVQPISAEMFGVAAHVRAATDYDIYYTTGTCIRRYSVNVGSRSDNSFAGDCNKSGDQAGGVNDARFGRLGDIAISANKQVLYVADRENHKLWMIHVPQGRVWSLAGGGAEGSIDGQAKFARFKEPVGLDVGSDGYLYVADQGNHVIRRLKLP